MIVFSVIGLLLVLLALEFILSPLRHPERFTDAHTIAEANMAVFRRQLAELASDLRHQTITNEQFQRDREELERRVLADLPKESRATKKARPGFGFDMLVYGLTVGVPLAAVLLYLILGTPSVLGE